MDFFPAVAADADGSAMFLYDSLAHPQTQSGAFGFFGGKERLEDPGQIGGSNSRTGIGHGNADARAATAIRDLTHAKRNASWRMNGFERVQHQIGKYLAQFAGEGANGADVGISSLDGNLSLIQLPAK